VIQLSEITKSFGDRVLFDHVTWQITDRERVGLCGPNGAGKTTLLKMMAGLDGPDSGSVLKPAALTVGYLPQDGLTHSGHTLFDEAASAFEELLAVKQEMHALEARLGDPTIPEAEHDEMLHRYSDLQDRFRLNDGYSIELKTATVLQGLGFKTADFDRPTETFSGGWQMRIALARLLLKQPNLLLLDEPTNHLDLEARNWLEEYLTAYPHAVILVSHDRFFLDAVVTRIADLTLRTLTDYHTNYSGYLAEHHERIEALRKAKREQDEEVARVKMFIDRFRYKATKASQVQSRIKMLEKVVPIEVPPERKKIHFDFPVSAKSGRTVLELKRARKAYGDLVVFDRIDLHIERGDRIALVGPNGVGKSTLMRMLSGEEAPDAGERIIGHNVVMQYFAQDEATRMDGEPTVYETLASGSPHDMVPAIRNILGGFLFSGDDIVEHAAARRADEPSRPRFEGSAPRRARRLRRDADVRVARSLFRRAARDEDHRSRQRHGDRVPGNVQRIFVAQGAPRRGAGEAGGAGKAGRAGKKEAAACLAQARKRSRRAKADRCRSSQATARRSGAPVRNRQTRTRNRRMRTGDQRPRAGDGRARVLRKPRRRAADDRSPSGAHVESWRPDAPLGRVADLRLLGLSPRLRSESSPGELERMTVTKSSSDYKFVIIIQRGTPLTG
jgi:ATPase subunit of ABC transporter with duplicated ATPase domains